MFSEKLIENDCEKWEFAFTFLPEVMFCLDVIKYKFMTASWVIKLEPVPGTLFICDKRHCIICGGFVIFNQHKKFILNLRGWWLLYIWFMLWNRIEEMKFLHVLSLEKSWFQWWPFRFMNTGQLFFLGGFGYFDAWDYGHFVHTL